MKTEFLLALALVFSGAMAPYVYSGDEDLCMECHEPAEDWVGMSPEAILTEAQNPDNDMHEDNAGFSEEQMKAIITTLLAQ
ncbi:MAG: hypothetical protein IMF06_05325 [Proteobacteria bacterium]|nr:hypothetical protein [Pseudomonadota bacterium]